MIFWMAARARIRSTAGAGFDTASYTNAGAGVRLALWNGLGVVGEAAGDVLSGIEAVIGSAFADTITGAGGSDLLDGGGAGDRIWGEWRR